MSKSYFSHDYNTAADPKIALLLSEFGGIGYAVFWRVIEMLHMEPTHKLQRKRFLYSMLSKQLMTTEENIIKILDLCFSECELFSSDDDYFWSARVFRNIDKKNEKYSKRSEINAENGRKGGLAKASKILAKSSECLANPSEPSQIKVNEIKVNNKDLCSEVDITNEDHRDLIKIVGRTKKKSTARKKQLSPDFCVTDTHRELAVENGWPSPAGEIEAFRDYHTSRGNTMLDWDRAFYTWLRNAKKFKASEKPMSQYQISKKVANEAFNRDFEKNFGRPPRQFQEEIGNARFTRQVDRDFVLETEDDLS